MRDDMSDQHVAAATSPPLPKPGRIRRLPNGETSSPKLTAPAPHANVNPLLTHGWELRLTGLEG